ncbi:MAG: hypothetical protein LUH00_11945 [Lachnospiraceae bacterium]|nr:hypothetical protein [Lachnospiraceae bacterium]
MKQNRNEKDEKRAAHPKCDRLDVLIAVCCGSLAGVIDVLLVGSLGSFQGRAIRNSRLGSLSDRTTDELVMNCARLAGWKPREGKENNISSAIGYFERNFKVNYDQKNSLETGGKLALNTKNHHIKSLSHMPDAAGLFFSVLDQFMGTASFLEKGELIRIDTGSNSIRLEGKDFPAKLYCGFCNWLGHLISDVAGSSGSRGNANGGRGMGLAMPFSELFQLCHFGKFQIEKDRQDLATLMSRVYMAGYDARSFTAASYVVALEEMMIRLLWAIRRTYARGGLMVRRPMDSSAVLQNPQDASDLNMMLLIGNGTLCLIDGTHAAVKSQGNMLVFVLHMNLPAWIRFSMLVLKEVGTQLGTTADTLTAALWDYLLQVDTSLEKRQIEAFYRRVRDSKETAEHLFCQFCAEEENRYQEECRLLDACTDPSASAEVQARRSAKLARDLGVPEERIIENPGKLDRLFGRKSRKTNPLPMEEENK